ncbi:bacillithiol system redox-active protein YtxJ [Wenyingzhuangia aestuarii]|uniref:bacillithiol system redox-active protein YtxJ n=1 Tax=Wenyingzhuangia aestuarii TaxID=1647582 RepID=UPI0014399345|nr:bacillithiol system redox-active protein YtxJ [Wenyingzhuangia aestuarii]NJB82356.1 bacillithiol system protein YtxJ [Wenyingzhuangia aestuarii]
MGFFDKILGSKSEGEQKTSKVKWNELTTVAQLEEVVAASKENKVVIFKHSTRCSISASVLNKFEKQIGEGYTLYFLDLIAHRDISAAIADKFKVVHQSPQAIFLENGKVTQQDSHYGILELTF